MGYIFVQICLWFCLLLQSSSYANKKIFSEEQWIRAEADNPQSFVGELQKQLDQMGDSATELESKILVLGRLAALCNLVEDANRLKPLLPLIGSLQPIALKMGLYGEAALMNVGLASWAFNQKDNSRAIELVDEALKWARQSQNANIIVMVLNYQSDLYYELDFDQKSLQSIL